MYDKSYMLHGQQLGALTHMPVPFSVFAAYVLYDSILDGIVNASVFAASDFIAGDNQSWAYYAGIAAGTAAASTGIPNAAAITYATGELIQARILKHPEGGFVDVFVDGLQVATIDAYAAAGQWEDILLNLALGEVIRRVDFVNRADTTRGQSFGSLFGIGQIVIDGNLTRSINSMASRASVSIQDADGNTASVAFYFDETGMTLADITTDVQNLITELDGVIDGQVIGVEVGLNIALPGGLKAAPAAGSNVQEGANLSYNTDEGYRHTYHVPAWSQAAFSAGVVDQTAAAGFLQEVLTDFPLTTPRTGTLLSLSSATKAFRRR